MKSHSISHISEDPWILFVPNHKTKGSMDLPIPSKNIHISVNCKYNLCEQKNIQYIYGSFRNLHHMRTNNPGVTSCNATRGTYIF